MWRIQTISKVGNIYERRLRKQFEDAGYEVMRSAASAFPDLMAWNEDELLFVEVKRAKNRNVLSTARHSFKKEAEVKRWNKHSKVLLWVYFNSPIQELVFEWREGKIVKIDGELNEPRKTISLTRKGGFGIMFQ